ncbi:MAG: hypothetical protein RID07_10335, partial [Lacipirellulaceae bacterium]
VWALIMLGVLLVSGSLVWAERGEEIAKKSSGVGQSLTAKQQVELKPIAIRKFAKRGRVELLAIGTHDEAKPQWWGLKGESIEDVPFTIRLTTNISPVPDRQLVFRTVGLEKNVKVRWRMTPPGNRSSATIVLDCKQHPANYYSHTFQRNQITKPFRLEVGVARGPWVTMAQNEGGSGATSILNKGVVISDGLLSSEGEATFIVSHDFTDAQARLIAVDRNGKAYEPRRRGFVAASVNNQTQYRFANLKLVDIAKVKFQTRSFEWVAFEGLPVDLGEPPTAKPQAEGLEVLTARVLLDQDEIKVARNNHDPRLFRLRPNHVDGQWIMLSEEGPIFTERDIAKTKAQKSEWGGHWDVLLELKPSAAKRMRERTTQLLAGGRDPNLRVAVLLDGKLLMAPTLNGVIGERLQISSGFDEQEAKALVEKLQPVSVEE